MRTSSTGTRNLDRSGRRGFTIIELMVVLAIIAIMTGVAVVAMTPALRDAKMRSACRMVASLINYARSTAVTTNSSVRVVFEDGTKGGVQVPASDTGDSSDAASDAAAEIASGAAPGVEQWVMLTTPSGRVRSLPEGVTITQISKAGETEDSQEESWIEFSRLGESESAVIELSGTDGDKKYVIVEPLTGRCRIKTSEELQTYLSES